LGGARGAGLGKLLGHGDGQRVGYTNHGGATRMAVSFSAEPAIARGKQGESRQGSQGADRRREATIVAWKVVHILVFLVVMRCHRGEGLPPE
jgi:hypothetical protein